MQFKKHITIITLALLCPFAGMAQSGVYDFTANITEGCDSFMVKFTFNNNSGVDTINSFAWDFGNGESSYIADPDSVFYNVPGPYTIILFFGRDATNMLENDPIIKSNYITVYPTITADFTYNDTTELGFYAVSFRHKDQPYVNAGIYSWDFGDGSFSDERNVVHTYPGPGTYNVKLSVSTPAGCNDSTEQAIVLTIPPGLPDIIASDTFACGEARVKFSLGNVDTDTIGAINWDFGNGTTSNSVDPDTVVYDNPGYYDVGVVINGDVVHGVVEQDLIHVQLLSPAEFSYTDTVTFDTYVLEHTGVTDDAATYTYLWDISDVGTRNGRREVVKFPAADTSYLVRLTVSDNFGCTSSGEVIIYIFEELYVQNVFTPNGDDVNDFFEISSIGDIPLSIKIFARTGTLVYKAEGPRIIWDGKTSWGLELSQGVYFYVLDALSGDPNNRYRKTGFIYLYR
ncbi:MAG: gliding motility-associated C-terminal domain-containing protein [Bacteroidales bacterium]|nr:gliding motility-associated C-terminal domain-containing protein [Bacteroidales bacterium]MBN2762529.1 gliding motility-associated C-terminal domain-containing protein [Bacteroidales bacterium]